jgi:hypothetical protein
VRLENVQDLLHDEEAIREAFYASGEYLSSPKAIRQLEEYWPDSGERFYIPSQPPNRIAMESAKLEPKPVVIEEETA